MQWLNMPTMLMPVQPDSWNERRTAVAAQYCRALAQADLRLPSVLAAAQPVWHLFVVRTGRRELLTQALERHGIGWLIHYPIPPHRQQAYRDEFGAASFPVAEAMAGELLILLASFNSPAESAITKAEEIPCPATSPMDTVKKELR